MTGKREDAAATTDNTAHAKTHLEGGPVLERRDALGLKVGVVIAVSQLAVFALAKGVDLAVSQHDRVPNATLRVGHLEA